MQQLIKHVAELEKLRVRLGLSTSALNVYLNLRPEDKEALRAVFGGEDEGNESELLFTGVAALFDTFIIRVYTFRF